ncbi:MAG: twin-arginine translocation signal domain-containing protein, partial [Rhodocyclaceae bacterium]|nr:twin-arginine translocation signal domain-containing protein [Rhodocyclaceae bacterium]
MTINANRRNFLKGTAALSAALVVGLDTSGLWAAASDAGLMP